MSQARKQAYVVTGLWRLHQAIAEEPRGKVLGITKSEIVWIFLGAGVLVWLLRAPPAWMKGGTVHGIAAPLAAFFAIDALDWHKLGQIAAYFAYAGSFVFGSGLAIVPFLYGGVVQSTTG